MPICPAEGCRQAITEGQGTIELSPGTLMRGKKTGGYYHSKTYEEKILIHYGCALRFFHPQADKDMYDHFYELVRTQVRREEMDDMKEEAIAEAADEIDKLCPSCREDRLHPDAPPEWAQCLECGATSSPICGNCGEIRMETEEEYIEKEEPPPEPTLPQPSVQPMPPFFNYNR